MSPVPRGGGQGPRRGRGNGRGSIKTQGAGVNAADVNGNSGPTRPKHGRWLERLTMEQRIERREKLPPKNHEGEYMWWEDAEGKVKRNYRGNLSDVVMDMYKDIQYLETLMDTKVENEERLKKEVEDLREFRAKFLNLKVGSTAGQEASPGSYTGSPESADGGDARSQQSTVEASKKNTTCLVTKDKEFEEKNEMASTDMSANIQSENGLTTPEEDTGDVVADAAKAAILLEQSTPDEEKEKSKRKAKNAAKREKEKKKRQAQREELEMRRKAMAEGTGLGDGGEGTSRGPKRGVSRSNDKNSNERRIDEFVNNCISNIDKVELSNILRLYENSSYSSQASVMEANEGSKIEPPAKRANVAESSGTGAKRSKPDLKKKWLNKSGELKPILRKKTPKQPDEHEFGIRIALPELPWEPERAEYLAKERSQAVDFILEILNQPEETWTKQMLNDEISHTHRENSGGRNGINRAVDPNDGKARMVEVNFKTRELAKEVMRKYNAQHQERVQKRIENKYAGEYIHRKVLPVRPKEDRKAFSWAKQEAAELQKKVHPESVNKYIPVRKSDGSYEVKLIVDKSHKNFVPREKYEEVRVNLRADRLKQKNAENNRLRKEYEEAMKAKKAEAEKNGNGVDQMGVDENESKEPK